MFDPCINPGLYHLQLFFPPQIKSQFVPSKFQLPLSCPMTAALSSGLPAARAHLHAMIPPNYRGSFGRMVPGALYAQQWPSMPSPGGSVVPVGLLGAPRVMSYAAMANPGIQTLSLVKPENSTSSKTTRTTWSASYKCVVCRTVQLLSAPSARDTCIVICWHSENNTYICSWLCEFVCVRIMCTYAFWLNKTEPYKKKNISPVVTSIFSCSLLLQFAPTFSCMLPLKTTLQSKYQRHGVQ